MENNEIELLIEKKLAEAKLEVAEKRLHYVIWTAGVVLAIFGVFIPIWMSNKSSDKVDVSLNQMRTEMSSVAQNLRADSRASTESLDKAVLSVKSEVRTEMDGQTRQLGSTAAKVDNSIQDMQKQFKELAGLQLRKPKIECLVKGSSIEGQKLKFSEQNKSISIDLKNTGDAPARHLRVYLYTTYGNDCNSLFIGRGNDCEISDDPNYKFVYYIDFGSQSSIHPKDTNNINISTEGPFTPGSYQSFLKVFFEEPEPAKHSFLIHIDPNKK